MMAMQRAFQTVCFSITQSTKAVRPVLCCQTRRLKHDFMITTAYGPDASNSISIKQHVFSLG